MQLCPCGSSKTYSDCCHVFISGQALPVTPEELMRSRYTAYTEGNIEYIAKTMKAPANENFDFEKTRLWAQQVNWIKLEVTHSRMEGEKGFVEFLAHYSQNNKRLVLHELSEFHRENGQWYYVDGKTPGQLAYTTKIARNDPCPCGSAKKYKKCCGNIV